MTKFSELGVRQEVLDALEDMGFKEAFPIQEATIPVLLTGRDVIGQAHTGTGKTGAYSISMLNQIIPKNGIQGLILAPTRELAVQITEEIKKFAKYTGIKVVSIYGGQSMGPQLSAIARGVEIIVATPGRLIDHLKRGSLDLDDIAHVVLDEADTMLDMGFIDDIQFILDKTPDEKTMSLFSATMPVEILRLSEEYLRNPKQFLLDADDLSGEGIDQSYLVIKDKDKMKYLIDFINQNKGRQSIVFCSTKHRTRDVTRMLHQSNFDAVAIEGDMSQHRREQAMGRFRTGKAEILVATDVAARGIDVPRVALVVNYDVPNQEMVYFHRIGRTARAGAKGRAITLVSYSSVGEFNLIKRQIKVKMTDLNQEMGIEINIPDPLKREVPQRRYGGYGGGARRGGGYGRSGGYGNRGGRFRRDGDARDGRVGKGGGRNNYGGRSYGGRSYGGNSSYRRDDDSRDNRKESGNSERKPYRKFSSEKNHYGLRSRW
ncbi:MAG: ATP-dependent helicase [Crenarchaeota archaeon]|nr:MAG: ATP-dependent helicase [Thermoproteota archaeon]RDJ32895.1 MAG: ATP-dependent helicase [Thermoproteota archaeon]RDJ36023.1 MAG: ATP-dependent helicase [Thermoproteota archaeon]RDJ38271.1 MAG: ATP-dependent helicase [Thermoproteota archaeon]